MVGDGGRNGHGPIDRSVFTFVCEGRLSDGNATPEAGKLRHPARRDKSREPIQKAPILRRQHNPRAGATHDYGCTRNDSERFSRSWTPIKVAQLVKSIALMASRCALATACNSACRLSLCKCKFCKSSSCVNLPSILDGLHHSKKRRKAMARTCPMGQLLPPSPVSTSQGLRWLSISHYHKVRCAHTHTHAHTHARMHTRSD